MDDIRVIEDPAAAVVSLDPTRSRLLDLLREPGSASSLASLTDLPRQKVNYHLRALEAVGLVELVEERRRGNMTERVLQATAAAFVISPSALASVAPDPQRFTDRFSAFWLLALAARLVEEVGRLIAGAATAGKTLPTFAIDGEVTFASAADRAAFAEELGITVGQLAARYHQPGGGGRRHRVVVALHPRLKNARANGPALMDTPAISPVAGLALEEKQ
ncbi:ArsR/SmtB family transcription factor [Arthrobacter sp. MDT2-2]